MGFLEKKNQKYENTRGLCVYYSDVGVIFTYTANRNTVTMIAM